MTVIAWDGQMMAADRRAIVNGLAFTMAAKITRLDADRLAGAAGSAAYSEAVLAWLRANGDAAAFPKAVADEYGLVLVACRDGQLLRYEGHPTPVVVADSFHAIGTGCDFAVAAMECGRNAREAVEVACRWSSECGNGIDVLTFETPT